MWNSPEELHEQALDLIRASALSEYFDQLAPRLDFSIELAVEDAPDGAIAVGANKIGGSPDVSSDFVWPFWKDEPLTFIAQFDLASIAPFDVNHRLPTEGMLSFFSMLRPMGFEPEDSLMHGAIGLDAETKGSWRVIHMSDSSQLERRVSPLSNPASAYPSQRISDVWYDISLPDCYELIAPDGIWEGDDFWGDTFEEYTDLWDEIYGLSSRSSIHQLLGYADYRQNDMRTDAARFGCRSTREMRLLAQFSSDSYRDLSFAGDGYGYFFVEKSDLKARDFSRPYFGVQR